MVVPVRNRDSLLPSRSETRFFRHIAGVISFTWQAGRQSKGCVWNGPFIRRICLRQPKPGLIIFTFFEDRHTCLCQPASQPAVKRETFPPLLSSQTKRSPEDQQTRPSFSLLCHHYHHHPPFVIRYIVWGVFFFSLSLSLVNCESGCIAQWLLHHCLF